MVFSEIRDDLFEMCELLGKELGNLKSNSTVFEGYVYVGWVIRIIEVQHLGNFSVFR